MSSHLAIAMLEHVLPKSESTLVDPKPEAELEPVVPAKSSSVGSATLTTTSKTGMHNFDSGTMATIPNSGSQFTPVALATTPNTESFNTDLVVLATTTPNTRSPNASLVA